MPDFTLNILCDDNKAEIPFYDMGPESGLQFGDQEILFSLPDNAHTHLVSNPARTFSAPPDNSPMDLTSGFDYVVSGQIDFTGTGRVQLILIQFSDKKRLNTHRVALEQGFSGFLLPATR